MFIKRTTKKLKDKSYVNHLLVESVATPKGPRHRVVCSLGSLAPAPKEQWLALAHNLQEALGNQGRLWPSGEPTEQIALQIRHVSPKRTTEKLLTIQTDQIELIEAREAGSVHVGHQMWQRLQLDQILQDAGLSAPSCLLSEVMTLNRLIAPSSELAMPDWVRRTALADILHKDFAQLNEARLYRNLDRLHPRRRQIERGLVEQERSLFGLEEQIYLYDLSSSYFEGQCLSNPKARRGYSRDHRPDCKQVVVGLVLDGEGFPKAHEVMAGNRADTTTVGEMLEALEKRVGKKSGATVVVDRGMAHTENLALIRARDYHYLVAGQLGEREDYLEEMMEEEGWHEVIRQPSPRNEGQKKVKVLVKAAAGISVEEQIALCWSEGRTQKDRAIRVKQEERFLNDLHGLAGRIERGQLKEASKVYESIGRLRERYSRVARYYAIGYEESNRRLQWEQNQQKKSLAERLDGTYLLKTSRSDLSVEQVWRTYMLLTRVETAFRNMKSPLMERPIFHHLEHRVEAHIFLCVLAYHLLVCIERAFLDEGIHTSWATLREQLATHQVVSVILPTREAKKLLIRRDTKPEEIHRQIYRTLRIPERIINPILRWES